MPHGSPPFRVLLEDNHLLVVAKPAGLPTMGVDRERPSLLSVAKQYIKEKYDKPGNVYLGIVSRLDAPVTGAVVMARTSKAARRLTEQFRQRQVDKIYWALVDPACDLPGGQLVDWLRKDERHRKVLRARPHSEGAQEARLSYHRLRKVKRALLLEIELETGRKHQIRVQLAVRGAPVFGDRKYGSHQEFPEGIALHAARITFTHPVRGVPVEITAPLPAAWRSYVPGQLS